MATMWDQLERAKVDIAPVRAQPLVEGFQRIGASGGGTTPVLDAGGIHSFAGGGGRPGKNVRHAALHLFP